MSANSKIAKNTVYLYIRSIFILIISVYSSRVLLNALGVEDFGIYNLVGGVVAMFSSLRVVFASCVQRFLNFEKGKGNVKRVRDIFCMSVEIHTALAVLFSIVVEVVGYWFITERLVVPDGRMDAALFVFHLSVLSTVIGILTIPYDSAVIANERFNFFAWTSMIETAAKLGIIYIVALSSFDKLKFYAVLLTLIVTIYRISYFIYCQRFAECRLKFVKDISIFKELASFAGWNFFGNTAFALTNEGINMMLNIFGGVVANAARGIAYQVRAAVNTLCLNVVTASQPFIVQQAATAERSIVFFYANRLSRIMYLITLLTVAPLIVYCEPILKLWLKTPPDYSVIFTQIVFIHSLIRSPHNQLDLLFKSYGDIKLYQVIDCITLMMSIPLAYFCLKMSYPLYFVFIAMIAAEAMNLTSIAILARYKLGYGLRSFMLDVIMPCTKYSIVIGLLSYIFYKYLFPTSFLTLIFYTVMLIISEVVASFFLLVDNEEKQYIKSIIK